MIKHRGIFLLLLVWVLLLSSASAIVLNNQHKYNDEIIDDLLQDKWTRVFGGNRIDQCFSVIQTKDQGYAFVGWTSSFGSGGTDVWLIKTDSAGNQIWNKTYGGIRRERGLSIQQTPEDGYIICGFSESYGKGLYDLWIVKTNEDGEEIWNKTYGGGDYDYGLSIIITQDNNYIVTGYTSSFGSINCDFWLIKIDFDGNIIWDSRYGGSLCESGFEVLEIDDGFIVTGYTESFGSGGYDAWVIKTDKSGNISWVKTYGGALEDVVRSIKETSDGGYILAGWTESSGSGNKDLWVFKIDYNGDILWEKTYGGVLDQGAYSIQKTNDNNFIIAGYSEIKDPSDFWLIKIDQLGRIIWQKTYGGILEDEAYCVKQTIDGGYIIGGWTRSFGAGREDIWLVKTDENGNSRTKAKPISLDNDLFQGSFVKFIIKFLHFKINGIGLFY